MLLSAVSGSRHAGIARRVENWKSEREWLRKQPGVDRNIATGRRAWLGAQKKKNGYRRVVHAASHARLRKVVFGRRASPRAGGSVRTLK